MGGKDHIPTEREKGLIRQMLGDLERAERQTGRISPLPADKTDFPLGLPAQEGPRTGMEKRLAFRFTPHWQLGLGISLLFENTR
ncbi:MAG: hypothetical protein RDV48_12555 [Candidatus Eremiobacteraeota bacterium]|nr:hypothetical protein [Candidatus Eremiobacteraeota bacterium]